MAPRKTENKKPARKKSQPQSRSKKSERANEDFYSSNDGYGYNSKSAAPDKAEKSPVKDQTSKNPKTGEPEKPLSPREEAEKTAHRKYEKSRENKSGYGYGHEEEERFTEKKDDVDLHYAAQGHYNHGKNHPQRSALSDHANQTRHRRPIADFTSFRHGHR